MLTYADAERNASLIKSLMLVEQHRASPSRLRFSRLS